MGDGEEGKGTEAAGTSGPEVAPEIEIDEIDVTVPGREFECPLCLKLLYDPLTIGCGHTFCRECIAACFKSMKKLCPLCRAPCHIDPASYPTCALIGMPRVLCCAMFSVIHIWSVCILVLVQRVINEARRQQRRGWGGRIGL